MKSYGLDVGGISSGLDVGFDVGYRVLEKQKQTCIERNPHASRGMHNITEQSVRRQRTKVLHQMLLHAQKLNVPSTNSRVVSWVLGLGWT